MEKININDTVYNLCKKYDFLKQILFDLGFKKIKNPILFNTVAKKMTLIKAIQMKDISIQTLNSKLKEFNNELDFCSNKNVDQKRIDLLKSSFLELVKTNDAEKVKNDVATNLQYVEPFEIGIAMEQLIKEGFTVEESKRTFYLRTIVLGGVLKQDYSNLNKTCLKLLDYFQTTNNEIKKIMVSLKTNISSNEKIYLINDIYSKLLRHYKFKEEIVLTTLKNEGVEEPLKVMSSVDLSILKVVEETINLNSQNILNDDLLNTKIDECIFKVSDMIFKEENVLIHLINDFVNEKSIEKMLTK